MTALKLPQAYRVATGNRALTKRIGIRFNGEERPGDVHAYDVAQGWIRLADGSKLFGTVEPYWREPSK